ncbi:MAG TPA: sigma-70 family RNA polymerase sigma factor [Ilumatobacter sp.]|nr:sigma-70 family RNA polymerase sigma factor [Ilumatobacter sp.]
MTTSLAGRVDIPDESPWARPTGGPVPQPAARAGATPTDITPTGPTFEELYATQYASMVRLAHALVDTRQRAEEVVQDAFAAVYERFDRLEHPTAYLRTCVLNGCRRAIRRRMLRRAREFAVVDSGSELTYNHVLDAVRRLPHKQRSMIALRYDLQLTDAEIAATLGVPIGTVKSTLHRALTALRQEIEQ